MKKGIIDKLHHVLVAGLLITFVFLALNSTCKPFCTVGLSHLHSLTMVAQFITLFAGLVIIVEKYIRQTLIAAGEEDTTVEKISIVTYLVYLLNGAVMVWPALDGFMQADPSETLTEFTNMCASFGSSGTASITPDHPIFDLADKVEESGPEHTTTLEHPDSEQQTQFQAESIQEESVQDDVHRSEGQFSVYSFEHAGGVRAQAQPETGQRLL